jgi:hypothetical protein
VFAMAWTIQATHWSNVNEGDPENRIVLFLVSTCFALSDIARCRRLN